AGDELRRGHDRRFARLSLHVRESERLLTTLGVGGLECAVPLLELGAKSLVLLREQRNLILLVVVAAGEQRESTGESKTGQPRTAHVSSFQSCGAGDRRERR